MGDALLDMAGRTTGMTSTRDDRSRVALDEYVGRMGGREGGQTHILGCVKRPMMSVQASTCLACVHFVSAP